MITKIIYFIFPFESKLIFLLQCVFEVDKDHGLLLTEVAEGVEMADIITSTGCEFRVSENLKPMGQIAVDE